MSAEEIDDRPTFYVTVPAHVTFYKYEVRAESLEAAQAAWAEQGSDAGEYVGYIDGDWEAGEPPADEWSTDDSWVEGHG